MRASGVSLFSDYIVYVDESGDHGLDRIDRDYPVFVLAFCIFAKSDYAQTVAPAVQRLKFKWFGHDIVVLHEREIRQQVPPFAFLKSEAVRAVFMRDLEAVVANAPFTLVAAVIDKLRLKERYRHPGNPYELSLRFCMERTQAFLHDRGAADRFTHLVVERRGAVEDAALELAFHRHRGLTTRFGPMDCFRLVFADKKVNSAGLQLADLIARPVGRHVLRPEQANRAFDVLSPKFRCGPAGQVQGYGLKVFP